MQDGDKITYFAKTDSRGKEVPFGIKASDRARHMYVIGKTGMGKSTLLENMAIQDIQSGEGLTFIDPHGGTAEKLLEYVPEQRVHDVLYFAPFDLAYPISFNVMESVEADKRHLVVNGLMSTFEKIWVDAWSARMAYILQNTLLALLEYPGATLLAVNRMYIDKEFRKRVVASVTDPTVRAFWVEEFAKYTDRFAAEATPAIQNKIGQFSSNALVRNIIGQEHSAFNLRELMDQKKIFIVNLSKGRVGEGNANLLGSMIITKLYLAAMSRADTAVSQMGKLPPHYLYVDEFQSFANRSFADILSEARKYKLALTIAHQYIEQMEEEVRAAVFGNVGTMITFRVGAYDAEILEKEFAPTFEVEDIVNLGARQIYLKLMIDGVSSAPFSATTLPPIEEPRVSHRDRVILFSRKTYARPREEVEAQIAAWHAPIVPERTVSVVGSPLASVPSHKKTMSGSDSAQTPRSSPRAAPAPSSSAPSQHVRDLKNVLAAVVNKGAASVQTHTAESPVAPSKKTEFFQKYRTNKQSPASQQATNRQGRALAGQHHTQKPPMHPKQDEKEITELSTHHRADLKKALAALMKNNTPSKEPPAPQAKEVANKNTSQHTSPQGVAAGPPEEELRRILDAP